MGNFEKLPSELIDRIGDGLDLQSKVNLSETGKVFSRHLDEELQNAKSVAKQLSLASGRKGVKSLVGRYPPYKAIKPSLRAELIARTISKTTPAKQKSLIEHARALPALEKFTILKEACSRYHIPYSRKNFLDDIADVPLSSSFEEILRGAGVSGSDNHFRSIVHLLGRWHEMSLQQRDRFLGYALPAFVHPFGHDELQIPGDSPANGSETFARLFLVVLENAQGDQQCQHLRYFEKILAKPGDLLDGGNNLGDYSFEFRHNLMAVSSAFTDLSVPDAVGSLPESFQRHLKSFMAIGRCLQLADTPSANPLDQFPALMAVATESSFNAKRGSLLGGIVAPFLTSNLRHVQPTHIEQYVRATAAYPNRLELIAKLSTPGTSNSSEHRPTYVSLLQNPANLRALLASMSAESRAARVASKQKGSHLPREAAS